MSSNEEGDVNFPKGGQDTKEATAFPYLFPLVTTLCKGKGGGGRALLHPRLSLSLPKGGGEVDTPLEAYHERVWEVGAP